MNAAVATASPWRAGIHRFGSVVCFSTADYDAPLWTNKQHIMSRLAEEVPVVYVESLALRRPRLTRRDLYRAYRRLWHNAGRKATGTRLQPANLTVVSPLVVPAHGSAAWRGLNRRIVERQLRRAGTVSRPRLLWTYTPLVVDEAPMNEFDYVVYHCVDDLREIPNVNRTLVDQLEPRLAKRADVVFATTPSLVERLSAWGRDVHHTPNVADFDHFSAGAELGEPKDLYAIPRPRAIFTGSLSDHKVDWNLIRGVAETAPDWSFVFVGPVGEEARMYGATSVRDRANCFLLGRRDYAELPRYLHHCDAALIPYALNAHTEAVHPLKLNEYLSAGLAVVSTPLPALVADPEVPVAYGKDAQAFVLALRSYLSDPPPRSSLLDYARTRTWDTLLNRMFEVMSDFSGR